MRNLRVGWGEGQSSLSIDFKTSGGSQEVRGHFCGPTGTADNHQRTAESLATNMGRASISLKTKLLFFGKKQELHCFFFYRQDTE